VCLGCNIPDSGIFKVLLDMAELSVYEISKELWQAFPHLNSVCLDGMNDNEKILDNRKR